MGNSNRVSFVPGGARGERLCSAQLDGPGTATVQGRGAGDGPSAQPWLPKACPARVSPVVSGHFRRTQSFYCYPRNYWWFYRPYTTAFDGHARCMPYFHYPDGPYGRRGAKPDRYIK